MFSPAEVVQNYLKASKLKTNLPFFKVFILALFAGFFIASSGVVINTAGHSIANISAVRILSGLLFPFGLGMVVLTGAELYTGNCLLTMPLLSRDVSILKMLRNWGISYAGNFAGAVITALGCVFFGQLNYSDGGLALFTIKIASAKCAMPFSSGLVLGIFCNILVCVAVFCSLSAKDTFGKLAGAYIPVAFFVLCGFEHSVANMYFIPAGLFAMSVPEYAKLALDTGVDVSYLTWENFFINNLIPVTIGNIIGGAAVGTAMWKCHTHS